MKNLGRIGIESEDLLGLIIIFYILFVMMNIKPLEDNILLEVIEEEKVTSAWIVLLDKKEERPSKWVVVAFGEWKVLENGTRWAMDVEKWDVVYFKKHHADEIEVGWVNYIVVRHNAVIARERK